MLTSKAESILHNYLTIWINKIEYIILFKFTKMKLREKMLLGLLATSSLPGLSIAKEISGEVSKNFRKKFSLI
jgi:hypothetical protein